MKPTGPTDGSGQSRYYAFGPFVLDGLRGMLWQYGQPVPLTPKVIQLLAVLLSRAGDVLPTDELIRDVWAGTVVEENNLARHVSTIRKALGERPGQRECIATIPGVGYRFVAAVEVLDELPAQYRSMTSAPDVSELERAIDGGASASDVSTSPRVARGSAWLTLAAAASVVASVTATVWMVGAGDRRVDGVGAPPRALRQLSYGSGLQQDPAWSSDGRRIAYAADHSGSADLWVQTIGGSEPVRLTSSPFNDWQPSWSPNGEEIVFRSERDGGGLYLVSTRGGVEQRLVDFGAYPQWSQSGEWALFSAGAARCVRGGAHVPHGTTRRAAARGHSRVEPAEALVEPADHREHPAEHRDLRRVQDPNGQPLTLKYRVVAYDGEFPADRLNQLFSEWRTT